MEILQPVRARCERWRIADIRTYDGCQLLTLVNGHGSRRLLAPFDDVEPIAPAARPRRVGLRRWRHACRAALASDAPPGTLRSAARARMDLLPHQLAPALAVVRGLGSRVLLADDVGLGKTIQAGLVAAELIARQAVERVLVVTPSGVRDQWAHELRGRFAIDASIADARTLRSMTAALPVGVNPWTTLPIAIASLDYVKRPEVLPAVLDVSWDIVIVDEAHAAAGESGRHAAVRALATRAPYVLLLTATPHNGDERAFAALSALGRIDGLDPDRLLVFRRTRQSVRGDRTRRVRTLHVRPTRFERRMHEALARYSRAVRDEHGERALALSVLAKRAFSSPWSLAHSIDRRLAQLQGVPLDGERQLPLPIGDGEGTDEDEPPVWPVDLALADAERERRLLDGIRASAMAACAGTESKLAVLQRLVARIRESILIFTEYRDTARHLAARMPRPALLLHGGLERGERTAVIDEFHRRPRAILIATDAAGQGLNLHRACRLVVNVELPWNPMRLEQRIGRVDRIGQLRTVHAIHLVSRSTGEARILVRLRTRVEAARGTIGAPDPVGGAAAAGGAASRPELVSVDLAHDAAAEAQRVARARAFLAAAEAVPPDDETARPLLARARRGRLRAALRGRALVVWRVTQADASGRPTESELCALSMHGTPDSAASLERLHSFVLRHNSRQAAPRVWARFWATRLARERASAESAIHERVLFQPALFDRRADRLNAAAIEAAAEHERDVRARLTSLERRAAPGDVSIEPLLILVPR